MFILLFGEKNEPRRTAAPYRAFSLARRRLARGLRNSLRSHSPRPLSALGCRPPGPIRAVSPFPYLRVFACIPFVPFTFLFEWGHCHSPLDGESKGFFCSFFSSARRTNQEEPPPGIGLFRSDADASRGAAELAALTQSSPFSALGCRPPGPIRAVFLFSLFACLCFFPFFLLLPFRLKGEGTVIPCLAGNRCGSGTS